MKDYIDTEGRLSKIEQWKEDIVPIIKEIGSDVKTINWKLTIATGFLAALQLTAPFIWPQIVKAVENLTK